MERDFLGSGSRNAPITVKEETSDSSRDSVPSGGLGMQWSFSNKVSATPQFLSFKPSQEDWSRKSTNDHLVSPGFNPTSVADAFDSNQKPHYSAVQSMQHFDAHKVHRPQELRIFPHTNQTNQTIRVSMSAPTFQSHFLSTGKNFVSSSINVQPLGGVPIMAPPVSILPAPSSVVGTTDIRSAAKPVGAPAQLTIFYAGSVCVYDDVSPEKAHAIMLLAGNESATPQNKATPTAQVQAPIPRSPASGVFVGSNSHAMPPSSSPASGVFVGSNSHAMTSSSALPSPVSTISHVVSQSGARPSITNEVPTVKSIGGLSSPCTQTERSKMSCSIGPTATNMIPAVALPQARKASLARFLEKRKERVTNTAPYSIDKKFSDDGRAPESEALTSSVNSAASCYLPVTTLH